MKNIQLNEFEALNIIHIIEAKAKQVLRDKIMNKELRDCTLSELRKLHDKITDVFDDLI